MSLPDAIKKAGGTGDEWLTPLSLWGEIQERYFGGPGGGFVFDPCPNATRLLPGTIHRRGDGLEFGWEYPAFVNPPFSDIRPWVEKSWRKGVMRGEIIVMLLPVRADQGWWHEFSGKAKIIFIRGRVNYELPEGGKTAGASFPSCLLIFGMGWDGMVEYWWPECHKNRRKVSV